MRGFEINSFAEKSTFVLKAEIKDKIKKEIESNSKEYILSVDRVLFEAYLFDKFKLEPLIIDFENEEVEQVMSYKGKKQAWPRQTLYEIDVYKFKIKYPYTGSSVFFKVKPDEWKMVSEILVIDEIDKTVGFFIEVEETNKVFFENRKSQIQRNAFSNYNFTHKNTDVWNSKIREDISEIFDSTKNKYTKENNFFSAINVKINKQTEVIFSPPPIKKIVIPQPSFKKEKSFGFVPQLPDLIYEDVLNVIYKAGKSMERKPSLYLAKDEMALRDLFLFLLETRYEATTATGETFNRSGKTDILLKYAPDGTNLFVAECKIWNGPKELSSAINQLFEKYLTWNDSKTALIFFVNIKNMTQIIEAANVEIKKHKYFKIFVEQKEDSWFKYIFKLPQDEDKTVHLSVQFYHYDKI